MKESEAITEISFRYCCREVWVLKKAARELFDQYASIVSFLLASETEHFNLFTILKTDALLVNSIIY